MADFDEDAREEGKCGYICDELDSPCGHTEGWGYENSTSGFCKPHGERGGQEGNQNAVGNDGGAPEENGNAIKHGARADPVNLYKNLDDESLAWVDGLIDGYLEIATFGEDDPRVERLQMACTIMYQEWAAREVVLREGPSEDTTIGVSEAGTPVIRTDEHHLTTTASTHNQTVRMNLKDLGLLDDPESQQADSMRSIAEILSEESEE